MYSISLSDVSCTCTISTSQTAQAIRLTEHQGSDVEPCVWSVVEVDVAIVCACLPTFRPLFDPKVRASSKRAQNIEPAIDASKAPLNRRSGYENMEGEANSKFLARYPLRAQFSETDDLWREEAPTRPKCLLQSSDGRELKGNGDERRASEDSSSNALSKSSL